MAPTEFRAPEIFSFDAKDWPSWINRFERFLLTELNKKDEEIQISALVYTMGETAEDILSSFSLSSTDAKKYDKIKEAFTTHFVGKRNVVYDRAMFGQRTQEDGESIEAFVTAVHALSQHCDYGTLRESLVRDRIVLGVSDHQLSEKLMMIEKLDLQKAIDLAKQWEAVKRQQSDLNEHNKNLDSLDRKRHHQNNFRLNQESSTKFSSPTSSKKPAKSGTCKFCGKEHEYLKSKCPAFGKKCSTCNELNHWSVCCPIKNPSAKPELGARMDRVERPEATAFIGAIHNKERGLTREQRWTATVLVDQNPVEFKLDPGADVTTLPYCTFKKFWRHRKLNKTAFQLFGPDETKLNVMGKCSCVLSINGRHFREEIYVVKTLKKPLLGLAACEELKLVKRLNNVTVKSTSVRPQQEYPTLFTGLGKMNQTYSIKLQPDAKPFALHSPRRIPIPLMEKVKMKLELLVKDEVIEPVDDATEWCAPLVTVAKPNGDIRLCVDLTALNRSVEREFYPMPVVEHTLGQLTGAKYFSKLDAYSGFYQIMLSPESRSYTTFITPFGRFRFQRLPFGISSAPEHFQKRMTEILKNLLGIVIHVDDILVFGNTMEEHDQRLRATLQRIHEAGVTLNAEKCEFGLTSVKFLGHIIDDHGIRPDPSKVAAIQEMGPPSDVTGVKRFLGMTNYLARFIVHLSTLSQPLYDLTKKGNQFVWGPSQHHAFQQIKNVLVSAPVLVLYDPNKFTVVSSDASSFGLGAVLLQRQESGEMKPVAYASRSLSTSERRYAQIEKECLGIVWACDRFRDFILGLQFQIETDHKPLLPILTTKNIDDLSPRLQRFRMRMMWYSYTMKYVPGNALVTADALSRQPQPTTGDLKFHDEVDAHVCHIVSQLPATDNRISQIWSAQQQDQLLTTVMKFCTSEWPSKAPCDKNLKAYYHVRDELTVQNGLLLRNCRLVIPKPLRDEILGKLHEGHLGIVKCRWRAQQSCWWPGISQDIEEVVRRCPICVQERKERKEPLLPMEFPSRPWQRIGVDLFKCQNRWFLLAVDYFSRYPEVCEVKTMNTAAIINILKIIFSRHGIPEEVISDNGPQFHPMVTSPFQQFAMEYGFVHRTSSPRYPQANGFVENGVKIMKNLLTKNQDCYKAILEYRATPLANGYSPAELLMGRRIRTTLPMNPERLVPQEIDTFNLRIKEESRRCRQKRDYDRHHGAREKDAFSQGEIVWIKDLRIWGTIVDKANSPRSYIVQTTRGEFRRNSSHLTRAHTSILPDESPTLEIEEQEVDYRNDMSSPVRPNTTRFGRLVKPRRRLIEEI